MKADVTTQGLMLTSYHNSIKIHINLIQGTEYGEYQYIMNALPDHESDFLEF